MQSKSIFRRRMCMYSTRKQVFDFEGPLVIDGGGVCVSSLTGGHRFCPMYTQATGCRIGSCRTHDWPPRRDLRKASRWTETFRTPTSMDFLRLHHRRSPSDQEVIQLISALHISDKPPEINRVIVGMTGARRIGANAPFAFVR
ncbi:MULTISPECIES: MFS transporter [Rhizobium]